MATYISKCLLIALSLVVLGLISLSLSGQAIVRGAPETKTLDRNLEPVIVTGSKVALLNGTPVQHLFVYTYTGSGWGNQIPVQVDEVTATGSYTSVEDGLLDTNDEIVFLAKDLGNHAPETDPLTMTLTVSNTWYEIEVIDPTAPTKKGWAYLVRSNSLTSTVNQDYVQYNSVTQHLKTAQYELGFATNGPSPHFFGSNYLTLNGSGIDLLDRTKLRVVAPFLGTVITLTEESLSNPTTTLLKDGPVRALIRQTGNIAVAGPQEAIYRAYLALFQGTAKVDFSSLGLKISRIRTSIDLESGAAGPSTKFYNANTSAGVMINGIPDPIAATPLSRWGQVSHTTGRLIQIIDPSPAGGIAKNFYRDNTTPEDKDTGQPGSYGDAGVLIEGNLNQIFSLQSTFFTLPPTGGPANVGALYAQYVANPLTFTVKLPPGFVRAYLPLITRH